MTQTDRVLKHLRTHGPITPFEALMVYRITRLAARIYELRARGLNVVARIKKDATGARYTEYRLEAEKPVEASPCRPQAQPLPQQGELWPNLGPCNYNLAIRFSW